MFAERDLDRIIFQYRLAYGSVAAADYASIEADYYEQAVASPGGFTRDLAELVLPVGGLATYGGAWLAGSLLGWNFRGAHYLAMLDASLKWKHDSGVGASWMAPHEWDRWLDIRHD